MLITYPCPLIEESYAFALRHFTYDWIHVEKVHANGQWKIIIWLRDFMLFQFEFMDAVFGLDKAFAEECLQHAVSDGNYKYLPDSDEIIVRILEYIRKPNKKWYLPYIRTHLHLLDRERLYKHLDERVVSKAKVERLIQSLSKQE